MTRTAPRRFYLVRHGEAKPKEEDPERGLTEAGHAAVTRMASWAVDADIQVDEIRHSGKLRAEQTAETFARHLRRPIHAVSGLAPNDDVVSVAGLMNSEQGSTMLVGHLPFLERLAARLVCGDAATSILTLDAGALLELTLADDSWRVTCVMQPRLLPGR